MTLRQTIKTGDIVTRCKDDRAWHTVHIVAVETNCDGSAVAHCRCYSPSKRRPQTAKLRSQPIAVMHAPIDAASFNSGWELIGNEEPSVEDRWAYSEYLRAQGLAISDVPPTDEHELAITHFERGNSLAEHGQEWQAIAEFTDAIEASPTLFEVFDNRALTYLILGFYKTALDDFQQSLILNPEGRKAQVGQIECLVALDKLDKAEEALAKATLSRSLQGHDLSKWEAMVRTARNSKKH